MANEIKWKDADFRWNDNPHTWDEVLLVKSLVEADGAGPDEIAWNVNNELDPQYPRKIMDFYQGQNEKRWSHGLCLFVQICERFTINLIY